MLYEAIIKRLAKGVLVALILTSLFAIVLGFVAPEDKAVNDLNRQLNQIQSEVN